MTKPLKALIIEDNERDEAMLLRELSRGGYELRSERVETPEALNAALDRQSWDIVLSDYSLPRFSAPAALALVRQRGLDLPFIIISGTIGEDAAVDSMRAGANDFMPKGMMARLLPAIEREVREAQARAERQKMREQLMISERMASVGMLAASVAHEINNPLAVVLANLEFALQQLDAPMKGDVLLSKPLREAVERPLRDALDATERVSHIVRDLKVFSRSNNEEQQGPVDIERVLESAARMASNEVRHRADLVRNYTKVPPVHGNEARLGQVFLNLIVNAAQAITEGRADENRIMLSILPGADHRVMIEVSDTGCGMTADVAAHIFDPFFTTKPEGIGTGLGLAICQRIIASLRGEISVESRRGQGTTFRVSLPCAKTADPVSAVPVAEAAGQRRGRILVVDDEPMLCATVERILSPQHEVITVQSARQALQMIEQGERFDLILSDLMMPQMTGIEFYGALRQVAPALADKMVFMTGGAFSAEASAFLDRSSNPTIDKPFKSSALRSLVQELMQ